MRHLPKPCPSCPWRMNARASEIPNFDMELAEGLTDTTTGELGAPIMACHQSREGNSFPCAGWLVKHGQDSIAIRINVMTERLPPEALTPGEDWPELHETYEEVLDKLRATR